MIDLWWTVNYHAGVYQAFARGRGLGYPVTVDTRALGVPQATCAAAEADGWASGLPPDVDYTPVTARPAPVRSAPVTLSPPVVAAVSEPVLAPAPEPSRVLVAAPLSEPVVVEAPKPLKRRAAAKPATKSTTTRRGK